jgi:CheY-like chemotaxis protein
MAVNLEPQEVPATAATTAVTVLVVEDNPITRKMLRVSLESDGYRVAEAGEGRQARAAAAARRPDVVVLDFVLPDIDGVRLLAEIRRDLGAPELPAVVVTGMVSCLEALRAQGGTSTQFLPKPVEPSRLLDVVRAHLAPPGNGRGRTILVLDDEPLNLKLAALRLRHAGYEVETASAGEEALEKARRRPPDAILSDVLMSSMDGFAFCGEARRDPRLAAIPIVLVSSAYAEEADRELARQMGANALVVRSEGLRHAIVALDEALRVGGPPLARQGGEPLAALHRERIQNQLDRQAAQNQALLHPGQRQRHHREAAGRRRAFARRGGPARGAAAAPARRLVEPGGALLAQDRRRAARRLLGERQRPAAHRPHRRAGPGPRLVAQPRPPR